MGAFAESERFLIRERQREGIALAKQRGAYKGRKKILTPERAAELVQRADNGVPKAALSGLLQGLEGHLVGQGLELADRASLGLGGCLPGEVVGSGVFVEFVGW
jgi:hypothetical protein